MAHDPLKYFRIEAREILEELGGAVLALERPPLAPELVPRLLRLAHTLKGAARVVKQREIAEQAHRFEDTLEPLRDAATPPAKAQVDGLLALIDGLRARVAALDALPEPAGASASAPARDEGLRPTRAASAEVDVVLDGLAELGVQLGALRRVAGQLERGVHAASLVSRHLAGGRPEAGASLVDTLQRELGTTQRALAVALERVERELSQTRYGAETLRLAPVSGLLAALERTARDAAHATGKGVELETKGGDIRVDAPVLAAIQPALIQLVRNAVAHGIEGESARRVGGKPSRGQVTIEVWRRGNRALFCCSDDGRGLDLEAVRRAAVQRGLPIAPGADRVEALFSLLLRGGVSTASAVTEVAGRGVGLDVVRDAVSRLGGDVNVRTEAGKGTAITLGVPISLAALNALAVELDGAEVFLPLEAVRTTIALKPDALVRTATGVALRLDDDLVPFAPLGAPLGVARAGAPGRSAVLLSTRAGNVAVGVDRLLGPREVVLRSLPPLAPVAAVVAGATLDVDGNPQVVVDADALAAAVREGAPVALASPPTRLPILVIDDSLTTRMLEQSILESAGYEVELAVSAEDGLEKARARRFGLFLVDVEMPGMDGFGFVAQTRADPVLGEVPAILVTSRAAPEDRRRGAEVGASAYIVKAEFEQDRLLETIRRLTGEA